MSILHYFGTDPDKRAKFIFNFIAPIYGYVDKGLQNRFAKTAALLNNKIALEGKRILDVGCGTGAWGACLAVHNKSLSVGVDFSEKMLLEAIKKHPNITFKQARAEDLSMFNDNEFDIVTASYVLHGVTKEPRAKMLKEMRRVAKEFVVVHDFYGKTEPFVQLLEFMERSDYKNFKRDFEKEMQELFPKTELYDTTYGTALYIGIKK